MLEKIDLDQSTESWYSAWLANFLRSFVEKFGSLKGIKQKQVDDALTSESTELSLQEMQVSGSGDPEAHQVD